MSEDVVVEGFGLPTWRQRVKELEAYIEKLEEKYSGVVRALDSYTGTPCEQIRHQQQIEELKAENAELKKALTRYLWKA